MKKLPDYDREHDLSKNGERTCWCNPTIESYPSGDLIIHHSPVEAVEEAQRILNESEPFD